TSLSEYSYCQHVVLIGVLHRDLLELKGELIAAQRNIFSDPDLDKVREVELGEICHLIYQAINRGHARVLNGIQAGHMDAWVMVQYRNQLHEVLKSRCHGLKYILEQGTFLETGRGNNNKRGKLVDFFIQELRALRKLGIRRRSVR